MFPVAGSRGFGRNTQNAGTAIVQLIPPMPNALARLAYLVYNNGATAHTLYVMRCLGQTTVASDAAASQAVINITADPGAYSTTYPGGTSSVGDNGIAANDYVVYQCADGTYVVDTVASVSTLAITMTSNVPTGGIKAGAPFWWFGIYSDTNPSNAQAHPKYVMAASTITTLGGSAGEANGGGIVGSIPHPSFFVPTSANSGTKVGWNGSPTGPGGINQNGFGEPLILYDANATNAGFIEEAIAVYSDR